MLCSEHCSVPRKMPLTPSCKLLILVSLMLFGVFNLHLPKCESCVFKYKDDQITFSWKFEMEPQISDIILTS